MSVTITRALQTGPNTWQVSWSSDLASPTYYLWQDGRLRGTQQATSALFTCADGAQLLIDIFDNADDRPADVYPGTLRLEWYSVAGAAQYRIEESMAGVWTQRALIQAETAWHYQWESRFLEDCQTHQFRVIPIAASGNEGAPLLFSAFIVRHPDIPAANFAYSTGQITIT